MSDRFQRGAVLLTAFLYSAGYAAVGLLAILASAVLEGVVSRRLPWQRSPLDLLVIAFVAVFLVSGLLSPYAAMAIATTGLAALTIYITLGTLARILRRDARFLRPLLWSWIIGAALAAIWAIALHLRTGMPAAMPGLGHNAVGTTMLVAAIMGLGLFFASKGAARYIAAAIASLAAVALLFTFTRGAWLGAVAGFALLVGMGGRKVAWGGLLMILAAVLAGGVIAGPERSLLIQRAANIANLSVHEGRIFLLRSAVAIFTDHPILGTGMNTFPFIYSQYRLSGDVNPADARPNAHNIILNMAAEGGLLGLAVFLAILVQTFRLGWLWRRSAQGEADLALRTALLAAFVGMLAHQFFDGTVLSVHIGAGMWMLMAILTSGRS